MNDLNHKPVDRIIYARATRPVEHRADKLINQIALSKEKLPVDTNVPGETAPRLRLYPNCTNFAAQLIKLGKGAIIGHEHTQLSSLSLPAAKDLLVIKVPAERMAMRYAV